MATITQRITPCLWFDSQAEEAVKFYTSIFKNSKIDGTTYYDEASSKAAGRPKGSVPADTVITVYNGAEEKLASTIAYLEKTFGVQVKTKADPTIPVDVVITVGRNTPNLQAPPSS